MSKPYEVRPSAIHGKGVFANRSFRRNELMGTFEGERTRRNGKYVLWVEDGDDVIGIRGTGDLRYLNHSKRPNASMRGDQLYALRSIEPGAEITIDYGGDWESSASPATRR